MAVLINSCSCIDFIKRYYSLNGRLYNPFYLLKHYKDYGLTKIDKPVIGSLAITKENKVYGHIGYVIEVKEDLVRVIDRNYIPCKITNRWINKDLIIGYLNRE